MASAIHFTAGVAAVLLAGFCLAAKPKPPAPPPVVDLTVAPTRYSVKCPLPKQASCVIRKPVDTGYRILTAGLDMEDRGDHWVADFAKTETAKSKLQIRVLGRSGDLHEIAVSFQNVAAAGANGDKK